MTKHFFEKSLKTFMQTVMKSERVIIWSMLLLFASCLNQYEKSAVGFYKVGHYELIDSAKSVKYDIPTLTLKADKTFSLDFKRKKIEGKWKADNYRDFTVADFYYQGHDIQGEINENKIDIVNPYLFNCPFLKSMVFEKIKEDTEKN